MEDVSLYRSEIAEIITRINKDKYEDVSQMEKDCDTLIDYATQKREHSLEGFAYYHKGRALYIQNDIAGFYLQLLNAMKPLTLNREWELIAKVYISLGSLAIGRGNLPLAMDYYFKAMDYCNEYSYAELKAVVQTCVGSIYNLVGDYDEAILYLDESRKFIENHMAMNHFVEHLSRVLVELGKAYIGNDNIEAASEMKSQIDSKAYSFLQAAGKINVNCFYASLSVKTNQEELFHNAKGEILSNINKGCPILDIFTDVTAYLALALEKGEQDSFDTIKNVLLPIAKDSGVKNLEKKLLELSMNYYKEKGEMEKYFGLMPGYIEVQGQMESENNLMVSTMVALRKDFFRLSDELKAEKERAEGLRLQSESDPITGIPNRIKLEKHLNLAFDRSISNGVGFAIELLDIDFYTEYTDNYGHYRGDECLVFVSKFLKEIQNEHEGVFCAHYGGDTFAIVFEGYSEEEVFGIAKKLKNKIVEAKRVNDVAEGALKIVTISQGIYWGMPQEAQNVWAYVNEADLILYKVKQKSTNSIMVGKAKSDDDKKTLCEKADKFIITEPKIESYEHYGQGENE